MMHKKNINTVLRLTFICLTALCVYLMPAPANADCTLPNGKAGEVIFNDTHKVLQYCNDTYWIAIGGGGGSLPIPDGNKGAFTVSNNGQTWALNYPGCPSGWTAQSGRAFCYSPLQTANYPHDAQAICSRNYGARVCSIGEYYLLEANGGNRWAQGLCGSTEGMQVTVGTGWGCAYWSTQRQYRCCKANPSTPIP